MCMIVFFCCVCGLAKLCMFKWFVLMVYSVSLVCCCVWFLDNLIYLWVWIGFVGRWWFVFLWSV